MDISRNSNDIVARHLAGALPRGVLEVIGIHGANVVRAMPADLPKVEVREERSDILLELDDGRLMHLEFQSTKEPHLYRFLRYDTAIAEKYRRKVRTVVLYTGDVEEAPEELDAGTIRYRVENVYLNRLDGDGVLETLRRHLAADAWDEADRVRLAFAFHMGFRKQTREEAFEEIVELVRRVPEREERDYVTALILGFSGRVLTEEQSRRLEEVLKMADLLKTLEQKALEKGLQQGMRQVAERMFKKGASLEDVMEVTGLSQEEAEEIRKKVSE
ncbi:MAG: transposase [Alicyclobacillaceae bacterium]|nr:transposase [Alicyclobacillaceae bacterium]